MNMYRKKRKITSNKKLLMGCLILFTLVVGNTGLLHAVAAGTDSVSVDLTLEQVFQRGKEVVKDATEKATYKLIATDKNSPMPAGGKDGVYTLSIAGNKEEHLVMAYKAAGTYHYTLQVSTETKFEHYTVPKTEYQIEIIVKRKLGGDLACWAVLIKNQEGSKQDGMLFNYLGNDAQTVVKPPETETETETEKETKKAAARRDSQAANQNTGSQVRTGDENRFAKWIVIMSTSLVIIFFVITKKKSDRRAESTYCNQK